ncbi:MAG: hypothetical protein CMH64_03735 [Nanoarchaeota archaeon]|nr:hypothetical protein [Nanoarchaeota archaeon]|tara:strand:+ start:1868 stop:2404 length:537 start_codon:yes stop_codon:yes gene_type:complete
MFSSKKRGLFLLVISILFLVETSSSQNSFFCGNLKAVSFSSCNQGLQFCGDNNLILNGGFEEVEDNQPVGFDRTEHGVSLSDGYSGDNSMLLRSRFNSYLYSIDLDVDKEYLFSAYVKGQCGGLRVYYGPEGNNQELTKSNLGSINSQEWRKINARFTPENGEGNIRVECNESENLRS